jgi:hypothetical protein
VKSNCVVYRYDKRWDLPGLLRKCIAGIEVGHFGGEIM